MPYLGLIFLKASVASPRYSYNDPKISWTRHTSFPSCSWLEIVKYLFAILRDRQQNMHLDSHKARNAMYSSVVTSGVLVTW